MSLSDFDLLETRPVAEVEMEEEELIRCIVVRCCG